MEKGIVVHPYHGLLFRNKEEQTAETFTNLGRFEENYAEKEKSFSKGYIWYDAIYITFLKRQNYRDGEQVGGCQVVAVVGAEGEPFCILTAIVCT